MKRWIGLLLALALLCPCLALAEAAQPRTEAGRQVAEYMDEAGVKYQLDTSTEYDVFLRAFSPARAEGRNFTLYSVPLEARAWSSLDTELAAAVGPCVSLPALGDTPSARGLPAARPSGRAPTS